jgi:FkbM family methyltransferase
MRLTSILAIKFNGLLRPFGLKLLRDASIPKGCDVCRDLRGFPSLSPIATIIDVGANVGQSVERFLREFPRAMIVSCEPAPAAFAKLSANYGAHPRVLCKEIALGSRESTAVMQIDSDVSELNSIVRKPDQSVSGGDRVLVQMDTLDHLLEMLNVRVVDLLKIDTEGFEIDVLNGGEVYLSSGRVKAVLAECAFNRADERHTYFPEMYERLQAYGFLFEGLYDIARFSSRIHYANALFILRDLRSSEKFSFDEAQDAAS